MLSSCDLSSSLLSAVVLRLLWYCFKSNCLLFQILLISELCTVTLLLLTFEDYMTFELLTLSYFTVIQ